MGAIDGMHISASAPSGRNTAFRDRRSDITQNVMRACNFDMRFMYVHYQVAIKWGYRYKAPVWLVYPWLLHQSISGYLVEIGMIPSKNPSSGLHLLFSYVGQINYQG